MKLRWTWHSTRLMLGLLLVVIVVGTALFCEFKPVKSVELANSMAHIAGCVDCHSAQTQDFLSTPHAQTLRRADQPSEWNRFIKHAVQIGDPKVEFRYWIERGRLWGSSENGNSPSAVDWIFGSGHHGQTAVTLRTNNNGESVAVEHHVTWYVNHGLDRTIGRPMDLGRDSHDIGEQNDPETTRRCFGCHATGLSEGAHRIDQQSFSPGIFCARCHTGADQHENDMRSEQAATKFDHWRSLTPLQSVSRCGKCHRLPTDLAPSELTPKNNNLPRFAAVGLIMSKCFQLQHTQPTATTRLDCVTCHDPHRPTETEPNHYNRSCRECHNGNPASWLTCREQSLNTNCISCHMPKQTSDSPTLFTDHWIRVRKERERNNFPKF
jgi:hypothetical protein